MNLSTRQLRMFVLLAQTLSFSRTADQMCVTQPTLSKLVRDIEQSMGVPKGRTAAQAWLSGYIEEMKASGFVAAALKRHGIQGAAVAPARGGS